MPLRRGDVPRVAELSLSLTLLLFYDARAARGWCLLSSKIRARLVLGDQLRLSGRVLLPLRATAPAPDCCCRADGVWGCGELLPHAIPAVGKSPSTSAGVARGLPTTVRVG